MFICLRFPVFHGVALLCGPTVQLVAHHNELGTMVYNGEARRWIQTGGPPPTATTLAVGSIPAVLV